MIFTDEQRWDTLGAYGNSYINTPNLDRLASEGVIYDTAFTPCPVCTPARISTITGLAPSYMDCLGNAGPKVAREEESIPNFLREQGYISQAVGKLHFSRPYKNLYGFDSVLINEEDRGTRKAKSVDEVVFDDYDRFLIEKKAYGWTLPATQGQAEIKPAISPIPKELHSTYWVAENSIDFIKNRRPKDKPFFLFTSFIKPHIPYDCPQHLVNMYDTENIIKPWLSKDDGCDKNPIFEAIRDAREFNLYSEKAKLLTKAYYYANITFIDEEIGRILKTLEEENLEEDTLIIFASDHGDLMGDHDLWLKSFGFEGSARVPLIIKWKGKVEGGKRCHELVTLMDIFPTIMEAAGAKYGDSVRPGKNLMSFNGVSGEETRDLVVLEYGMPPRHMTHIRTKKWKYLHYSNGGYEQLFDLENDPHELHDLSKDEKYRSVIDELTEAGIEWIKRYGNPELSIENDKFTHHEFSEKVIPATARNDDPSGPDLMPWAHVVPPKFMDEKKKSWFWKLGYEDWHDIIVKLKGE